MVLVRYGSTIGVFSENYVARLDIGTRAMKKNTPASHESWATRLYIRRVDGPSVGNVEDTHLVGIFSEKHGKRLDIGEGSMKEKVPVTHFSHATKLKIRSLTNKNDGDVIQYGDLVGVFSENGQHRLDIGSGACNETPDSHNSWATRLRIQQADPIVEVTSVSNTKYLVDQSKVLSTQQEGLFSLKIPNDTHHEQTVHLGESATVTETSEFSHTIGFKVGAETTFTTGIPFIEKGQIKVSFEASYEHSWGETKSEQKSYSWSIDPVVPPQRILDVLVVVSKSNIEVPYEMTGDFKHLSGEYTRETVSGVFRGTTSHDLVVQYKSTDLEGNEVAGETSESVPM